MDTNQHQAFSPLQFLLNINSCLTSSPICWGHTSLANCFHLLWITRVNQFKYKDKQVTWRRESENLKGWKLAYILIKRKKKKNLSLNACLAGLAFQPLHFFAQWNQGTSVTRSFSRPVCYQNVMFSTCTCII